MYDIFRKVSLVCSCALIKMERYIPMGQENDRKQPIFFRLLHTSPLCLPIYDGQESMYNYFILLTILYKHIIKFYTIGMFFTFFCRNIGRKSVLNSYFSGTYYFVAFCLTVLLNYLSW